MAKKKNIQIDPEVKSELKRLRKLEREHNLLQEEHALSRVPIFNEKRAGQIKPIRFSDPIRNMVSKLKGEEAEDLVRPASLHN